MGVFVLKGLVMEVESICNGDQDTEDYEEPFFERDFPVMLPLHLGYILIIIDQLDQWFIYRILKEFKKRVKE